MPVSGWKAAEMQGRVHKSDSLQLVTRRSDRDFPFVNYSHPSEAQTSRNRKIVRSLVTKKQHKDKKLVTIGCIGQKFKSEATNSLLPPGAHPTTNPSKPPTSQGILMACKASQRRKVDGLPDHVDHRSRKLQHESKKGGLVRLCEFKRGWHTYSIVIGGDSLSRPEIGGTNIGDVEQWWLMLERRSSSDPGKTASRDVVILMTASSCGQESRFRPKLTDLLRLKIKAIEGLKAALDDDTICIADQAIAAVAQMAAYEVLFGDVLTGCTHMKGLMRMISMRGGLLNLGLDGLLEEFLLWIDSNISHILGNSFFFDGSHFPTSTPQVKHPIPSLEEFTYAGGCPMLQ